jgi:hypothetical protein
MLTQIFIKDDGCKTEYTKIVSHSFGFTGNFFIGAQLIDRLYFAGDYDPATVEAKYPVWSATKYDVLELYTAGSLRLRADEKSAGIVLPINLVPNDKITLSGTAYYPYYQEWINSGFTSVTLIVGVYYFNCSDEEPRLFTFIPVTLTDFDESGTACFNAEVTLGSSFDFHETRIVIGYNTYATGDDEAPADVPTILTVSHTLDIERPCEVLPSNFIIKNCCEGSITELVNIPGLVVGNFHVDDEGNCWEVMEQSTDVTNFTRTFVDNYATCLECQDANPCPLNLTILSCCVPGIEYVTGSLPGLVVGDTFVDNYGLCWTVAEETGAPISEESITVDTIIMGNCEACTIANPCPNFYIVKSCCTGINGTIAVPDVLNTGDSFVDAQGLCWEVTGEAQSLPTIYGIEVVTVYPYQGDGVEPTACELCKTANPCPEEYFITIKSCCDPDRVEVAQVPAAFMLFTEGTIFRDIWGICWEVISFNTTGIETYIIADWTTNPNFPTFNDCKSCRPKQTSPCALYEIRECGSETTTIAVLNFTPTIGLFYSLGLPTTTCYEIIGYGYPVIGELYPILIGVPISATTCEECEFYSKNLKRVRWEYCDAPGVTHVADTTLSGAFNYAYRVSVQVPVGGDKKTACIRLIGLTTDPVDSTIVGVINTYINCPSCLGG